MKAEENILTSNDSRKLLDLMAQNNYTSKEYDEIIKAQERKIQLLEENQKNLEKIIEKTQTNTSDYDNIEKNTLEIQDINNYLLNNLKIKNFNENITNKSLSIFKKEVTNYKNDNEILKRENNILNQQMDYLLTEKINITDNQIMTVNNRIDTTNTLIIQQKQTLSTYLNNINKNITEKTLKLEYKINDTKKENELLFKFIYNQNNRNLKDKLISAIPALTILLSFRKFGIKNSLKTIKGYYKIRKEGLLDVAYYLKRNEYLANLSSDILLNYLLHEENWNKMPNPNFNPEIFRKERSDMPEKLNPLVYYALYHEGHNWKTK